MIIFGYPGIGKTTLAIKEGNDFIDLESSLFKSNTTDMYWYKTYGLVAESLSEQGFTVLVSTHPEVINFLEDCLTDKMIIYPDLSLKDKWIKKLEKRKDMSFAYKNKMAYLHVKEHFTNDISALEKYIDRHKNIRGLIISNMNYDLESLIKEERI